MIKLRLPHLAVAALAATGCVEQAIPTEPLTEQAVFNALGGLRLGESISLTGAAASQVLFGGSAVGGEFVVVPFHASTTPQANLVIEATGETLGAGAADPARLPVSSGIFEVDPAVVAGWDQHAALRERQIAEVAPMLREVQASFSRGVRPPTPRTDLSGGNAFVGQLVDLNANAFGDACETFNVRSGRVEAITDRAIVVGDVNNPSGGFTRADYEEFGQAFDDLVHPAVTAYFPEPTDIDENGKVIIFFTRAVNELTGPDDEGFVGGFFWARDLFPAPDCAASNSGEIFFVLAPDPNAEASHIPHSRNAVFNRAVGTIGHEYQHLINAGRRIYVNTTAQAFEETWLDEGLSHIAEEVIFYAASGLSPESNVTLDVVRSSQRILDAANQFAVQNLVRYGLYLEDVAEESPIGSDRLETRGATWSFLRWAADHSERPETEFFRQLGDSALTGFGNLATVLGVPIDDFQLWGVSVYTDDLLTAGDSLFQQPSWHFRSLLPALFGEFPLVVHDLDEGETTDLTIESASSAYIRVQGGRGETSKVVLTSGDETPPDELRVTVVRVE